uniref:Transmembrane protein n=1 Tax=Glossina brevipalpis TaxID=37001 RepID=A0A1A9W3G8_9MUSC
MSLHVTDFSIPLQLLFSSFRKKFVLFILSLLLGIQLSVSASLLLLSSSTITTRTRAVKMNFTLKRGHYVELSSSLSHTYSLLMRPPTIAIQLIIFIKSHHDTPYNTMKATSLKSYAPLESKPVKL